jgi:hypothetical protein
MAKFRIFAYGKAFANLLGGEIAGDTFQTDFLSDTIKVSLHSNSYTPNLDTHETLADVTNEITGTGYTAGGATLASKTITYTKADDWATSRANSTAYAVGDVVRPASANGHLYRCIVAGTSAGSPPTFPTVSGQTYTDGGATFAEIGRGITVIDAADPSWPSSTLTGVRYAVVARSTGTANTSPLLFLIEFLAEDGTTPADVATSAAALTIVLAALGLFNFATP